MATHVDPVFSIRDALADLWAESSRVEKTGAINCSAQLVTVEVCRTLHNRMDELQIETLRLAEAMVRGDEVDEAEADRLRRLIERRLDLNELDDVGRGTDNLVRLATIDYGNIEGNFIEWFFSYCNQAQVSPDVLIEIFSRNVQGFDRAWKSAHHTGS